MTENLLDGESKHNIGLSDKLLENMCSVNSLDFSFLSEERARSYKSQDYAGGLGSEMLKEDEDRLVTALKTVKSPLKRVTILSLLVFTELPKRRGGLETYKYLVATEVGDKRFSELE